MYQLVHWVVSSKVCDRSLCRYWNAMPESFKRVGVRSEQEIRDWLDRYQFEHMGNNGYRLLTDDQELLVV